MTKRQSFIALALVSLLALGLWALPASAQPETVTVTLADGRTLSMVLDVAPGAPLSSLHIPGVSEPIVSISASPAPSSSSPTTTSPSSAPAGSGPAFPTPPAQPTPKPKGPATVLPGEPGAASASQAQRTTNGANPKGKVKGKKGASAPVPAAVPVPKVAAPAPALANPTFTFTLPSSTAVGVPDSFLESFRVPLFLMPIYQAAGTEYDVPWQVLAAINEIETDYGRDLSVSSAGAEGWMQFLPSTWKSYGVDANQDGKKDPYTPSDAIFAAARYLKAAGAEHNLRGAIFAYNNANWYVDSVLLRAKLIGGLPDRLVGSLTGLAEGHFPVDARATYADDAVTAARAPRPKGVAPEPMGVDIFSRSGAAVIAAQDGRVVKIGASTRLGRYVVLQDAFGNTYTYSGLGKIAATYPVPKPPSALSTAEVARELNVSPAATALPKPTGPASAGHQPAQPVSAPASPAPAAAPAAAVPAANACVTKERLFAGPARPDNVSVGGKEQLADHGQPMPPGETFSSFFAQAFGLRSSDVVLKPLVAGAPVVAGTILGRIGRVSPHVKPHVLFQIRPAGKGAPLIDPYPVINGWKLLEATSIYGAGKANPFLGPKALDPTAGQIFLMGKEALARRVLADPRVTIYDCGRRDIAAGDVDQRVLGAIEFMSVSGFQPKVSSLKCGKGAAASDTSGSARSSGDTADIVALNGTPVLGHTGPGSITDMAVRTLLHLEGIFKPHLIISTLSYPGTDNTVGLPDHANHIHIEYLPMYSNDPKLAKHISSVLKAPQWIKLIDRLNQIQNPSVPLTPSAAAIPDQPAGAAKSGSGG